MKTCCSSLSSKGLSASKKDAFLLCCKAVVEKLIGPISPRQLPTASANANISIIHLHTHTHVYAAKKRKWKIQVDKAASSIGQQKAKSHSILLFKYLTFSIISTIIVVQRHHCYISTTGATNNPDVNKPT